MLLMLILLMSLTQREVGQVRAQARRTGLPCGAFILEDGNGPSNSNVGNADVIHFLILYKGFLELHGEVERSRTLNNEWNELLLNNIDGKHTLIIKIKA